MVSYYSPCSRAEHMMAEDLESCFVSVPGIPAANHLGENRVVVGRRGSGKSHMLASEMARALRCGVLPVRVDIRVVGSWNSFYGNEELSPKVQARRCFRDLVGGIADTLAASLTELEFSSNEAFLAATRAVEALHSELMAPQQVPGSAETRNAATNEEGREHSSSGSLGLGQLKLGASRQRTVSETSESAVTQHMETVDHVDLRVLTAALSQFISVAPIDGLLVTIDEWACVSEEVHQELLPMVLAGVGSKPEVGVLVADSERGSTRTTVLHDVVHRELLDSIVWLDKVHARAAFQPEGNSFLERLLLAHTSLASRASEPWAPTQLADLFVEPDVATPLLTAVSMLNPRIALNMIRGVGENRRLASADLLATLHEDFSHRLEYLDSLRFSPPGDLWREVARLVECNGWGPVAVPRDVEEPMRELVTAGVLSVVIEARSSNTAFTCLPHPGCVLHISASAVVSGVEALQRGGRQGPKLVIGSNDADRSGQHP